jgi:hypothetical protein
MRGLTKLSLSLASGRTEGVRLLQRQGSSRRRQHPIIPRVRVADVAPLGAQREGSPRPPIPLGAQEPFVISTGPRSYPRGGRCRARPRRAKIHGCHLARSGGAHHACAGDAKRAACLDRSPLYAIDFCRSWVGALKDAQCNPHLVTPSQCHRMDGGVAE